MVRVLIAEDSPVQLQFLQFLLERSGDFRVIGTARDGSDAVQKTEALRPDIILMDCYMPGTDGLEATRRIMEECPTPIVLASATLAPDEARITFDAMKYGALAVVEKPAGINTPGHEKMTEVLLRTLRLMSEVKVVGRRTHRIEPKAAERRAVAVRHRADVIAIGGSTGAPGVIADILGGLDSPQMAPILIVQHLTEGFVARFVDWLDSKTALSVCLGADGIQVERGHVYLAPDGTQMGISAGGRLQLTDDPADEGFRPGANYLFGAVAKAYGERGLGVLLTGMGSDGATGLLAMHKAGAHTVAQSKESCVVYGMPRAAVQLGAATDVLPPKLIINLIKSSQSGKAEKLDARTNQSSVA